MGANEAWGYAFNSEHSLDTMVAILNDGPWTWQMRDSTWYGDYLQALPVSGCRVRIHDPRQPTQVAPHGAWDGTSPPYHLTVVRGPESEVGRKEIDDAVHDLLVRLSARDIAECEPFD